MSHIPRRLLGFGTLALVMLALTGGIAAAQEGPGVSDDEVNAVAEQLYCPICENVPLDVCPTQACADWRAEIRDLLEQGNSEEQVKAHFVERYGVRVLGEPPRTGFSGLVWLLPLVGFAAGALMLVRSLARMRGATASATPAAQATATPGDEFAAYAARLERELRDFSR